MLFKENIISKDPSQNVLNITKLQILLTQKCFQSIKDQCHKTIISKWKQKPNCRARGLEWLIKWPMDIPKVCSCMGRQRGRFERGHLQPCLVYLCYYHLTPKNKFKQGMVGLRNFHTHTALYNLFFSFMF